MPPRADRTIDAVRVVAAALAAGPPIFAAIAALVPVRASAMFLVGPAVLAGMLSPALGYRYYHAKILKIPPEADLLARAVAFRNATWISLAIPSAIALFGVAAYALSREWIALLGVATHLLVAGAVWPSRERLDRFLHAGGSRV